MKNSLCIFLSFLYIIPLLAQETDLAKYVNPFIGTQNDGNTFMGVSYPFGMVKLGPDCGNLGSNSGYTTEGKIHGFSHTHVSGTGGGPKYGNVLLFPFVGDVIIDNYGSDRGKEMAEAGYCSTELADSHILAELTSTEKTGIHQYTFPSGKQAGILIDAGSFLGKEHCCFENQQLVGSEIQIISDTEIQGYTRVRGGWNIGGAYTVYFYARFDKPASAFGTWKNGTKNPGNKTAFDSGDPVGAWFTYNNLDDNRILVKVGISFISTGKAKENYGKEAENLTFKEAVARNKETWNSYLQKIKINTKNQTEKVKFYTALYHSLLQPTDRTGENPLWQGKSPYYDDFYCIWDTYRTLHPLFSLIIPEREADIVNSLIEIQDKEGFLPDGRSGNATGNTQGGSNGDMLLAEAILKELKGIDEEKAFKALLKDAEIDPGADARKYGRGGLYDYLHLGYVSTDNERAGTRTVEYAANDWAIALSAKKLGKEEEYKKYGQRAANWENLWKNTTIADSVKGFIMPRKADGNWDDNYRDPTSNYYSDVSSNDALLLRKKIPAQYISQTPFDTRTKGNWNSFFYESHSWEYSLYVPQDVRRLIEKSGGRRDFIYRLDTFFGKGYYNITNEPGFLSPCLYIYAGAYPQTVRLVHHLLDKFYTDKPSGLPGNDDSGSMSSWFLFHQMGIFPNAGQDVYLITTPHFSSVTLDVGNKKILTIKANNLSDKNIYVVDAKLNGQKWDKAWFRHKDITNGGTLELTMSDTPTDWGTKVLPPSRSDSF